MRRFRSFHAECLESRLALAADLAMHIESPSSSEVSPGTEASYQITVANRGPEDATQVVFRHNLSEVFAGGGKWSQRTELPTAMDREIIDLGGARIVGNSPNRIGSSAGDVDGDGKSDLLIAESRTAWLYLGGDMAADDEFDLRQSQLDGWVRIEGAEAIITAVAGGDDINGDGLADFAIGAAGANRQRGAVYVVYGQASGFDETIDLGDLDGSTGFLIKGFSAELEFGTEATNAGIALDLGDVNGDGLADILIGGEPTNHVFFAETLAAAHVVFGNPTLGAVLELSELDGNNGFTITDGSRGECLCSDTGTGFGLSVVGDVNDDGVNDIGIGNWDGFAADGYVLFGSVQPRPALVDLSKIARDDRLRLRDPVVGTESDLNAIPGEDLFPRVRGLGDVSGDGVDDFIVGVGRIGRTGRFAVGQASVVFGGAGLATNFSSADLDGSNGFRISSQVEFGRVGLDAGGLGDFDGDGIHDFFVQAGRDEMASVLDPSEESAWILFGGANQAADVDLDALSGDQGVALPRSRQLRSAGDMNGDGRGDLLLGGFADGNRDSFVFFGQPRPEQIAQGS